MSRGSSPVALWRKMCCGRGKQAIPTLCHLGPASPPARCQPHFPVVLSPAQAVFIYSGSRSTISSHLSGCCALNKQALNMFSVWLRWELRDFVTKQ